MFLLLTRVTHNFPSPGKVVVPVFSSLILRYPTPESVLRDSSSLSTLTQLLLPLGLQNRRAATIIALSRKLPGFSGVCFLLLHFGKWSSDFVTLVKASKTRFISFS